MLDELLVGWADIAAALRRDERLVRTWADPVGFDPIPVSVYGERPEILRSRLERWRIRNLTDGASEERVYRMPAIARRAQMSVRAAHAAAAALVAPLPVQREPDGTIWSYASAIDDYVRARTWSYLAHRLLASRLATRRIARERQAEGLASARTGRFRRQRRWPARVTAEEARRAAPRRAA